MTHCRTTSPLFRHSTILALFDAFGLRTIYRNLTADNKPHYMQQIPCTAGRGFHLIYRCTGPWTAII